MCHKRVGVFQSRVAADVIIRKPDRGSELTVASKVFANHVPRHVSEEAFSGIDKTIKKLSNAHRASLKDLCRWVHDAEINFSPFRYRITILVVACPRSCDLAVWARIKNYCQVFKNNFSTAFIIVSLTQKRL
ncbi:hypothetical protein D3C77_510980 [compost metagenome]